MFPEYIPVEANQLTENTSIALAKEIKISAIATDFSPEAIPTTYVKQGNGGTPILLLHGEALIKLMDLYALDPMRGLRYLQQNEISHSVICVITKDSLHYADELFEFFVKNKITDVGFNMEETEGVNQSSSLDGTETEATYRHFIKRFWELTSQSKGEFQLREFETLGSLIYNEERLQTTEMNHPFAIVNVDYQGNFSTFDPELLSVKTQDYGDFILGNLRQDSLESVCLSEKFQQIYQDLAAGVTLCRNTCPYFGVCGGGAGSNKYWENGTFNSAQTNSCRYRIQILTDIVVESLENSLGL